VFFERLSGCFLGFVFGLGLGVFYMSIIRDLLVRLGEFLNDLP